MIASNGKLLSLNFGLKGIVPGESRVGLQYT